MARFIIALILSVTAGAILFDLAAIADGMSDSMNAMLTLFPFGTIITMRTGWEHTGLVLTFIQFPVYVLQVMVLKGKRARIAVVIVILAIHVITARVGVRSNGTSRLSALTEIIEHT